MSTSQTDFNPSRYRLEPAGSAASPGKDLRDGSVYVYEDRITLAVRVALATGRPLLLLGPPGSGKSSLASFVARVMHWNYFEQVVTSRTRAQDLQWSFDVVRRLQDAQLGRMHERPEPYVEPRVLWWAFNPGDAAHRGATTLPAGVKPAAPPGILRGDDHPSVVLIDEVDKANPDIPNDLLVQFGSQRFPVDDIGREVVAANRILMFITSNKERSLPAAFLRRCVMHSLDPPSLDRLITIAENHFPSDAATAGDLFAAVASRVVAMRSDGSSEAPPSTAEYLDAVQACLKFGVRPGDSPIWDAINSAVLAKRAQDADSV